MTFEHFEKIVKQFRPEITVYQHGSFSNDKTNFRVNVQYSPNGKVYSYNGSYATVLKKLQIPCTLSEDLERTKKQLADAEARHGKPGLFGHISDQTEYITALKAEIEEMEKYPIV